MLKKETEQRQAVEMLGMEMLVPKDHLLRKVDKAVSFNHIYDLVEGLCCEDMMIDSQGKNIDENKRIRL